MKYAAILAILVAGCAAGSPADAKRAPRLPVDDITSGLDDGSVDELWVIARDAPGNAAGTEPASLRAKIGEREIPLPLKHTAVKGSIGLRVASVGMTQQYENPYSEKIEAVYTFPLPQDAAVTDFLMKIGDRTIRGIIRERAEAKRIYLAARKQGYGASMLEQPRPNVFTQSVANIEPGKRIDIAIEYFHTVRYADGAYHFVLPLVVGPRYKPGTAAIENLPPRTISAHDVSLELDIDAGFPMADLTCLSHRVTITRHDERRARVVLDAVDGAPNRDFVLRYKVAPEHAAGAVVTHTDDDSGYFSLVLQPPTDVAGVPRRAREMIFVVDCSGSMKGEPLSACKRAMRRCLARLGPADTFQIIRFSNSASQLGRKPLRATRENVAKGRRYLDALSADGGTEMINGIRAALGAPGDSERYRIVSFMTDGYIGNEKDILAEVQKRLGGARIFSFGVGNSVNRYLLQRMADVGRGVATYVRLDDSGADAVDGLYKRIERPALTDLRIDWGALGVTDVQPATLPDLFVGRPVAIAGRFRGGARPATVKVHGKLGKADVTIEIPFRPGERRHAAVGKLWARSKIRTLHDRMVTGGDAAELAKSIETLALRHGLVSDFTSFVAVDSSRRTEGEHGTTVPIPVPTPEGVKYQTTVK